MSSASEVVGATTVGELRLRIVRLAGPVCAAIVVGALAQLLIAGLVGHMGEDALFLRTAFSPLAFLVLAVHEGVDVSTQVGFARLRGAAARQGDGSGTTAPDLLRRFVGVGTGVLAAVVLLVVLAAPVLADIINTPDRLTAEVVAFIRWTALAYLFSTPTAVAGGALRGVGNTKAAATVVLVVAGLQVLLVWFVGLVGGLGVLAVPVGIAGAGLVSAGIAVVFLARAGLLRATPGATADVYGQDLPDVVEQPEPAASEPVVVRRLLLGIGLPVALSYLALTVSNTVMLWILGPAGEDVISGFGAAATVQVLVLVPAIGAAAATSIVMNQQWGAGDLSLLSRTLRAGWVVVACVYLPVGALTGLTAPWVATLLSGSASVAEQIELYLRIVGPSYAAMGIVLYLITLLEQIGYGRITVALHLSYQALSLGIGGALMHSSSGPSALWAAIAGVNVVALAAIFPLAVRLVRRRATGGAVTAVRT